jgi:hypothetical protein
LLHISLYIHISNDWEHNKKNVYLHYAFDVVYSVLFIFVSLGILHSTEYIYTRCKGGSSEVLPSALRLNLNKNRHSTCYCPTSLWNPTIHHVLAIFPPTFSIPFTLTIFSPYSGLDWRNDITAHQGL